MRGRHRRVSIERHAAYDSHIERRREYGRATIEAYRALSLNWRAITASSRRIYHAAAADVSISSPVPSHHGAGVISRSETRARVSFRRYRLSPSPRRYSATRISARAARCNMGISFLRARDAKPISLEMIYTFDCRYQCAAMTRNTNIDATTHRSGYRREARGAFLDASLRHMISR